MKSSVSHFISFITMILITILVSFIIIEINLRDRFMLANLNNINYYEKAYQSIILKVDQNIVNEEIKDNYKKYITKNMIKTDINNIIVNKKFEISHYSEFYKVINEYSNDEEICDKYASIINDIYVKNLFPISEYKLINKLTINTRECLIYSMVLFTIIIMFELALYIINKNLRYNKITILSSSILLLLPLICMHITGIFRHFIYTNQYYTKMFTNLINRTFNSLFIIGFVVFEVILIIELINKNKK